MEEERDVQKDKKTERSSLGAGGLREGEESDDSGGALFLPFRFIV